MNNDSAVSGAAEADIVSLNTNATLRATNSGLVMLFDRARGVMYELNETATAVVQRVGDNPCRVDDLVSDLATEFEAPREEIEIDVRQLVTDFVDAGLLSVGAAKAST